MAETAPAALARLYPPLERYWPNLGSVSAPQAAFLMLPNLEAFYGGAAGGGKALSVETPVATLSGWTTMGAIEPGDIVYGLDGNPTPVVAVSEVMDDHPTYRLTLDDGTVVEADADHRWLTFDANELAALTRRDPEWRRLRRERRPSRALAMAGPGRGNHPHPELAERNRLQPPSTKAAPAGTIRTTKEIASSLLTARGRRNHAIPVASPVQLPTRDLDIDPYLLGVWLGDGNSRSGQIACHPDDRPAMEEAFREAGFEVSALTTRYAFGTRRFSPFLRRAGLLANKHVPAEYLRGSVDQRLALLQGLMDTDGTCTKSGAVEFTNTNRRLAEAVYELVVSLGMKTRLREVRARLDGRDCGPNYRLKWTPTMPMFRLHRKLERQRVETRRTTRFRYVTGCERIESKPMRCIRVAAEDGLFLAGESMIPTHNSDALLAAALQYVDVPGYAALILRKTFRQLDQPDAIMARSKEWLTPHKANGVRWNDDAKRWTFPTAGEAATLTFGYLEHHDDVYNYQGAAYQFVGWDELTQFDPWPYEYRFSRTRRGHDLRELGIPIRHRSASNPGGIGHAWVKQRFINDETRESGAVFIPAKVDDNPGLDVDEYRLSLQNLDETLQQQLLDGDWGVFEGAAFVLTDAHLVDRFTLDDSINRFEALDYGLAGAPWGLWATDYEGNLVAVDMGYWRDTLPSEIAPEILAWRADTWGEENTCYADPSLWRRTGSRNAWGEPAMLNTEFSDNGVPLVKANNDPRAGMTRLRELLKPDPAHRFPSWHPRAGQSGSPRLFIVERACSDLVEELRAAPLQPIDKADGGEKVDPSWETKHGHAVAMARYAVMSRPEPSTEPPRPVEDVREEFIRRHHERRDTELERMRRSPQGVAYIT